MTETQQRFLQAIAERIPLDCVAEMHLFPPIRQGGVETGMAVVAATDAGNGGDVADDGEVVTPAGSPEGEVAPEPDAPSSATADPPALPPASRSRFTVHTARYRLTLKGPDRGKWEFDVVAEADAPLETVDAVVRGVQRRAGEGTEPERLPPDALRSALSAPALGG